jgi:hypothetical protein
MPDTDPPEPRHRGWRLLAPLALSACAVLAASGPHVDPLTSAAAPPPWLSPALPDPGQASPLEPH